ncbi:MAG: biopolymer transporter ExbD [Phycisphaerales bacterium]|nr:biopolymer transporter ExbD [Phycisphaerales bacterium]
MSNDRTTLESAHRPLRRRNIMDPSSEGFGPTMTPMVDVVLVILIFFMASTTIAGSEWFLRASLPEQQESLDRGSDSRYTLPSPTLRIEVFVRNGAVLVNGLGDQELLINQSIETIENLDDGARSQIVLLIVGGDDVPYHEIMRLHDAAAGNSIRVALE